MDPITFGSAVSESGLSGVTFPQLGTPSVWYLGPSAPAAVSEETDSQAATVRTLPEESGAALASRVPGGMQVRIVLSGVWDVVLVDSFDDISTPVPACALVLQVYEDDGETLAWEVGTSPTHDNPYLCQPENYGEQELDFTAGAATIGQVEVMVIDKAQIVGDQASGWMTERLSIEGITAIHGRRCRLLRYISSGFGYVVIADGPAGSPSLDSSYSAFRWTIRDTRETERKIRAFSNFPVNVSAFPRGVLEPWGSKGDGTYLLNEVTPLTGEYVIEGDIHYLNLDAYFSGDVEDPDTVADDEVILTDVLRDTGEPTSSEFLYTEHIVTYDEYGYVDRDEYRDFYKLTYGDLKLQWREVGEEAWNDVAELSRVVYQFGYTNFWDQGKHTVKNSTGDTVKAMGSLYPGSSFDTGLASGTSIEFRVLYTGTVSEDYPFYLETTSGQLLKDLYDGVYSPRDPLTGEIVPTGIRYDASAVLAMTDPVRMRITDAVDDLRDWTEKNIYAPSGWVPALDNQLRISPVSQVMPEDTADLMEISDEITEPVADWDAGELIVNALSLKYPRFYLGGDAPDGVAIRDVTIEFDDEASLALYDEQRLDLETVVFGAVGDADGATILGLPNETGYQLAQDRKLYVFNRYRYGAQAVRVPVIRSLHLGVPELLTHYSALLRPGGWVRFTLSWIPDYALQRRGASMLGQIIAIADEDCAWRTLTIEEVLPLPTES